MSYEGSNRSVELLIPLKRRLWTAH